MSGSYTLPWDIQLAGTFQHSRGIQTGGAGPSQLANWTLTSAAAAPMIGRNWTGVASRIVGLMWEGQDYGKHNLNQLDIKLAKRFTVGQGQAARRLRPLQRVQQQLAVHAEQYVREHGDVELAAPDQRAAAPLLQVRRAHQLLTCKVGS